MTGVIVRHEEFLPTSAAITLGLSNMEQKRRYVEVASLTNE